MAKEMLLSVLVNALGDFIEGITEENLKVGLWSGNIELRNLQLHRAGIEKLNLPVTVINGFVDSISVSVPWAHLASKPVKIFIEGINLLMGPLDMSGLDPTTAYERNIAANKAKLLKAEQAIELVAQLTQENDPKTISFFQNLATQILDNLEIRVSNIHIRYEDSTTFPGSTFACGVTLHSFVVTTTNDKWQETFHKATEGVSLVHKLGTIENLVVYWNTHSEELASLEFGSWKERMKYLIYSRDRAENLEQMQYIIGPPNALIIKLIHNGAPGAVPRVTVSVESMNTIINIDKLQYHQIMQTLEAQKTMESRQRLVAHRPNASTKDNARAWWQYGVILLTQNERLFTSKMALCLRCSRHRRRYIELCTKRKIFNSALVCDPLSKGEEEELDHMERTLPVESLIMFRQIAIKEAIVRNRQTKKEAAAKSKSWFRGWGGGGSSSKKADDDDVSLDDIQKDLEKAMHAHLADVGAFTLDFNFVSSTVVSITSSERPIAQMRMGLSAMCTLRGEGMQAEVHMTDLLMRDEFTPSPVVHNLVAVCSSPTPTPSPQSPFTITFRNTDGKIHVGVRALPLQITMNKFCIQQLLNVVQVDPANSAVSEMRALQNAYATAIAAYHPANASATDDDELSAWYALATAQLAERYGLDDAVRRPGSSIEVVFEADAPKIVIPEDSCNDMGFLLLDTGHLMIRGEMGPAGMAWNVKLSSINAALPRCAEELSTFSENCNYVIRPFAVEIDMQNIDKTVGNMTVAINMSPGIQGELSADKLSRLMHIADILPSTFSKLPSESPDSPAVAVRSPDTASRPTGTNLILIDSRRVDPFQRDIVLRANIPSIGLDLQYGSDEKERASLSIDMLSTDVTMRPYDMQIILDLKSLSIQDFTRAESQINLANTPLEDQESLVHISFTKLNHIKSPLYKEFGTEIILDFNKLFLNSDASTLLHLKPFYEVVLGKRLADYPPEPISSTVSQTRAPSTKAVVATAAPVLDYVPTGMHVTISLRTISLELLKEDMGEYSSSTANKVLDSVVRVDISGLTTEVTMAELMVVAVNIRSLTIVDTRYQSSDCHFNTILGPAALPQVAEQEEDLESKVDVERASSVDIISNRSSTSTDMLVLKFSQDNKNESTLNVDVGAITSFISLDAILDMVNIAVINAMAVVQLTAKGDSGSRAAPPRPDAEMADKQLTVSSPTSASTHVKVSGGDDSSKSMAIHIAMPGARVIMLEDPTVRETRAVCLRLGLIMHYFTVTAGDTEHKSVEESLHCAVSDVEVYVIMNMERNRPHQIMDPMSLLFNHKKTVEREIPLTIHISVGIDGLQTRFSLADLMLVQAILLRRTMVDSSPTADASAEQAVSSTSDPSEAQPLTRYQIKLNVGSVCAIVVNDLEGKNIPIVRLTVQDTLFDADGFVQDMQGGGSMVLMMDTYNPVVADWEPLIDPWAPSLTVNSDSTDLKLKVVSNERFQISITSTFLNSLSQTLSVLELMNEHRGNERGAVPPITFSNNLGMPIEIISATTGDSILFLDCDYEGAIFLNHRSAEDPNSDVPNRESVIVSRLPTAVDIHFRSPDMTDRQPLEAISLSTVSRHKYVIESRAESSVNQVPGEPIEEAIYQYKRYLPLKGWSDPCLLGDPPEWSNASGTKEIKKDNVPLPSEAWQWIGDWAVDKCGQQQGQVDKDGWEYATNFTDFTPTSKRRGEAHTLDYARRRKWVRSRVPMSNIEYPSLQKMALVWDVLLPDDGSKVITLRSCLQIQNLLPYAVVVQLSSNTWKDAVELGPLLPDGVLSVPLLFASAEIVRFKGADIPTGWTPPVSCGLRPLDYVISAEIACAEENGDSMLYILSVVKQVQKALHITLCPHISVTNTVPCRIGYNFFISGATKNDPKQQLLVEEGFLEPGDTCSLSHVNVKHIAHMALNIGDFGWSEISDPIFNNSTNSSRVNIPFVDKDGKVLLILRLRINLYRNKPFEIIVFSKEALINYTGLDISVDCLMEKGRSNRVRRSAGGIYDLTLAGSSGAAEATTGERSVQTPVGIESFVARSRRPYTITNTSIGDTVHTDRHYRFTFLPPVLNGQTFISTPCNDRDRRLDGSNMIQFTLTEPSVVVLLFDKRVAALPAWVKAKEYRATTLHATSCGVRDGLMNEVHYSVYGKRGGVGERVALGANHSADSRDMYSVFVLPSKDSPHNKILLEQLSYSCSTQEAVAQRSWCSGDNGIVLFNSENAKFDLCVNEDRARTSKELTMKILPAEKGPFEIVDKEANVAWQLAYRVVPLPGIFARTKVVSVMPRYCIANCTDQHLQIKQKDSESVICVEPFTSEGWHKSNAAGSTEVQFKSTATLWSLGTLDINELGTTEVLLPCVPSEGEEQLSHIVVNVHVKMASVEEHCAVSIVFWKSDPSLGSPLSIKNESSMPLYARQADVAYTKETASQFQITVPSGGWLPFGWAQPFGTNQVQISSGDMIDQPSTKSKTLPFMASEMKVGLSFGGSNVGKAVVTIETRVGGTIMYVKDAVSGEDVDVSHPSNVTADGDLRGASATGGDPTNASISVWISLKFAYVGVSIVADKPERREFLSLYADNIDLTYGMVPATNMQSVEVKVNDLQIDNYCETAVYPVLLRRVRQKGDKKEDEDALPFFQFALIRETTAGTPPGVQFRYITMRVIEFALEVDSSTIELLLSDVLSEYGVTSPSEALARTKPQHWISEYNGRLLSPMNRVELVNIFRSHMEAKASKLYFENIIIHPMKIGLTFLPTKTPQREEGNTNYIGMAVIEILTSMAAVELMELRFNSFIVKDAVESMNTLQTRVTSKLKQELIGQLAQIAGSLTVLGSPVGLVRNVGGGVQDFFYEPYQGLVQSPQDFLLGIKKGTSSLLTGVLGGVLNSTVGIVGSASSGLAYLTGDSDYVHQRALDRHRSKEQARHQGVAGGLKQGGKNVLSGFASGVTGIFTQPAEQIKKDGAIGIFAGIGKGVAGVAVKPILGITDGLSTIVSSITNEVNDDAFSSQKRPSRTFSRQNMDPSMLVLSPLDLAGASAQAYVVKKANKHGFKDRYVSNYALTTTSHLILSEKHVYLLLDGSDDWKCSWSDISQLVLRGPAIELYLDEDTPSQRPVRIQCSSESSAKKCYRIFSQNAHRLSNPKGVRDPEELHEGSSVAACTDLIDSSGGYVFGLANNNDVKHKDLSEKEIYKSLKDSLLNICSASDNDVWCEIDKIVWSNLFQWSSNHSGFKASRSLALILINTSSHAVQLTEFDLKRGKCVAIFGTTLYERGEKTIKPRGCVVIFVSAHPPNLHDSGHILLDMESNAFDLTVATRANKTACKGKDVFDCTFLEKSSTEWWSKYSVKIS